MKILATYELTGKHWFFNLVFICVFGTPLLCSGQQKDTTYYFNPLIEDITQRIPPLSDLIDSAIVHAPLLKYYDADIAEWRYKVKTASRFWMRNFYIDASIQNDFWNSYTDNSSDKINWNPQWSNQNNYRGIAGVSLRLPMEDLWDRKNQVKTATKEIEKSMAQKENQIVELRQQIITQYNQLSVNQKILKNANESVIAGAMNKEMGDKEFINGQNTLYDLAYIMEMYRVAIYNYETSRNAFYNSYMILQELCGFKFNVINKIE
ncbi:MAG: TolC family protein [Bacteroidetes bacterium]|nr:TolC family protein [Bacteroidota bacterium]